MHNMGVDACFIIVLRISKQGICIYTDGAWKWPRFYTCRQKYCGYNGKIQKLFKNQYQIDSGNLAQE